MFEIRHGKRDGLIEKRLVRRETGNCRCDSYQVYPSVHTNGTERVCQGTDVEDKFTPMNINTWRLTS